MSSKVAVPLHEPWLCSSAFLSDTVGLLSAGFREIHSWMCVQYEKHQKKHTLVKFHSKGCWSEIWIVWWPLNSFHFLQATASKTLIYLLQICNDKNLGMNHLPRYTSTLGLVRSHWNIFLRKAYLCIALQMKHYIIISHKRILFSGISTQAYRGHFYQPPMLHSSVH